MTIPVIHPTDLDALYSSGKKFDLIDVRTPVEFQEVHVEYARNVPLDQLDPARILQNRTAELNEPVYVLCRSGSRGQKACEKFIQNGYTNVINVVGGTLACIDAGLPVVRGKKVMSLERQVRIAAGSIVLTGTLLGWFISPEFYGLAAFVGAGLVFAGLSNTCAMGMLLARMPWNNVGTGPKAKCAS